MTYIDREKLRSLGVIGRRGEDRVREWRTDDGERHKAVTNEAGTITEHSRPMSTADRQDVLVRPQTVRLTTSREVLHGQA